MVADKPPCRARTESVGDLADGSIQAVTGCPGCPGRRCVVKRSGQRVFVINPG